MKKLILLFLVLVLALSLFAQGTTESASAYEVSKVSDPKYVFMFIGDEMSSPHINAAQIFNSNNIPR